MKFAGTVQTALLCSHYESSYAANATSASDSRFSRTVTIVCPLFLLKY